MIGGRDRPRPGGELAEDLDVLLGSRALAILELRQAFRIELQLGRVQRYLRILQLAQLPQLLGGELGLGRSAPAHDVDLPHPARGERFEGVLGDVGVPQLLHRLGQDAADVRRHVPLAHDDGDLLAQVEIPVAKVGVPVVPADELRRRVASQEVFPGDAEPAVASAPQGRSPRDRRPTALDRTSRPP
jgi:hypothetical protein